ncbi:phosphatidylinositol N-acetylglucosaminyltransferase subunit H [Drosophila kikkawai]|uniref:Phosphatidylinositol N-acetylglucosaminyltransferase subunit H n=1 Tax=Drosophila kikkawai TaxID=30033 RepID=A0A6P4ITJ0_DROKI|nr:uncharacterized protein LOC108077752 [Drosophila kikkawai]
MAHKEMTIHRYYSRKAKYAGYAEADLELCIRHCGGDVVRIELVNRLHGTELRRQLRRLLLLVFLATAYFVGVCGLWSRNIGLWQPRIIYPLVTWALVAILMLRSTLNLVHIERLFYSWDMALQTETVRSFGRQSVLCVQRGQIHDIVLNEVIEDLDVKYMLILRTKGSLFKKSPVIPLFNSQSPSFECLQHIHRVLHGYWLNSTKDRSEQSYNQDKLAVVAS